jgi:hypothetical protein
MQPGGPVRQPYAGVDYILQSGAKNSASGRLRKRDKLLPEEGGRGGRGAELYDRKKAWPSINHSLFSGWYEGYLLFIGYHQSPEIKETESSARIYRPGFRENKPKTLVFT